MELTSLSYFATLTLLFLGYWSLGQKGKVYLLLLGSYALYALWDLRFLGVLIGCTLIDFRLGVFLDQSSSDKKRKGVLLLSLAINLGVLFFFKYAGFFSGIAGLFLGHENSKPWLEVVFIPLGISFYTFHSISYIVDIFNRKIRACKDFCSYALYVSFFPKLIAGPIERTESFLPQILAPKIFSSRYFYEGLRLLIYGVFLKLVIGDRFGLAVDQMYLSRGSILEHWIGFYGYSIRIYADFFGYTLIARGSAKLFGLDLNPNFLFPYAAASLREFWRRWHISLSTWFRDYVYIPLGGAQKSRYRNVLISMTLAGLWHGADLKFVAWGAFHGLLICIQLLLFGNREPKSWAARCLGIFVTFHLVSAGWVFFQAKTFAQALDFFAGMFTGSPLTSQMGLEYLNWLGLLLALWFLGFLMSQLIGWKGENANVSATKLWIYPVRGLAAGLLILGIVFFGTSNAEPFVYYYF